MKTSTSISVKSNKVILMVITLISLATPSYSITQLVNMATAVNYNFAIPIACVFGLAIFLFNAFIKQKNH